MSLRRFFVVFVALFSLTCMPLVFAEDSAADLEQEWSDEDYQLVGGDYNGDSYPDAILHSRTQGEISLLRLSHVQPGEDGSEPEVTYSLTALPAEFNQIPFDSGHRLLIAADFTGDNFVDLLALRRDDVDNNSGESGYLFAGSAAGIDWVQPYQTLNKGNFKFLKNVTAYDYLTSDIDGSGGDDLLIFAKTLDQDPLPHGKHYIILSDDDGRLTKVHQKINPKSQTWAAHYHQVLIDDFNSDQLPDLFFVGKSSADPTHFIYGNSDFKFKKQNAVEYQPGFEDGKWSGDASYWIAGKLDENSPMEVLRVPVDAGLNNDGSANNSEIADAQNTQLAGCYSLMSLEPVSKAVTPNALCTTEPSPIIEPKPVIALPNVPPYLTVPTTDNDGAFIATWGSSTNASNSFVTYILEQKKDSGLYSAIYKVSSASTTSLSRSITGLADGIYTYRIKACNSSLQCTIYRYSNSVTVKKYVPPPVPPKPVINALPGTININTLFNVSWYVKSFGVTEYQLYRNNVLVYSGSSLSKAEYFTTGNQTITYTVRARNATGWSVLSSPVSTYIYAPPVATPSISPNGGSYTTSVSVSLASGTSGATIRYTTNNTAVTASSTVYSGPITLTTSATVRTKAFKSGMPDSAEKSVYFTVLQPVATPTISPGGGTFTGSVSVGLTSSTSGATLRYTTNNTTVTASSPVYSGPFSLTANATVKARAFKSGMADSSERSASFVVATSPWANNNAATVTDVDPVTPYVPANENVGAVAGEAGVSGGAASYSIPVTLAPGRNGMQPSVSLNYSSRGGNGLVGVGWGLSAGSGISRCGATFAQDGFTSGVSFNAATDKLCLDGQRLMVISGTYGASGAQYRTELDSFVLVKQTGAINSSGTTFEVLSNSGLIKHYGSRGAYGAEVVPYGQSRALSWMISKQENNADKNNILYEYSKDTAKAEVVLTDIHYTGEADIEGNRKVSFIYRNDRPDPSTSYLAGGKIRQTKLLSQIVASYNSQQVSRYSLNYAPTGTGIAGSQASGRTILRSVTACGNSATDCFAPTEFDWLENETHYKLERLKTSDGADIFAGGPSVELDRYVMPHGDRNGDGVRDWPGLYVDAEGHRELTHTPDNSSHDGFELDLCTYSVYTNSRVCVEGDFDLDGTTDSWGVANGYLRIGYTVNNSTSWKPTNVPMNSSYKSEVVHAADYTGDGWTDLIIVRYSNNANADIVLYANNGNTNAPFSESNKQVLHRYRAPLTGVKSTSIQYVGDMDGNGLPDFVRSETTLGEAKPHLSRLLLTRSSSSGAVSITSHDIDFFNNGTYRRRHLSMFFDVNGDGLQDILGWYGETSANYSNSLIAKLNLGNGTFGADIDLGITLPARAHKLPDPASDAPYIIHVAPRYGDAFRVMDINGDGRSELIMPSSEPEDMLVKGCVKAWDNGVYKFFCGTGVYTDIRLRPDQPNVWSPLTSNIDRSIYRYKALTFSENASGNIEATLQATGLIGAANHTQVIDGYGKGLADLIFNYGCLQYEINLGVCSLTRQPNSPEIDQLDLGTGHIYQNRNYGSGAGTEAHDYEPRDMLLKATNALGVENEWTYLPLSSSQNADSSGRNSAISYEDYKVYNQSGNSTSWAGPGQFAFASSMYVVTEFKQSNGVGGLNDTQYQYQDAVYNAQGRGFQGFRRIIVDSPSQVNASGNISERLRSTTNFLQEFPLAGQVKSAYTCLQSDGNKNCMTQPLSSSSTRYFISAPTTETVWAFAAKSVAKTYHLHSDGSRDPIPASTKTFYVGATDPGGINPSELDFDAINSLTIDPSAYDNYGNIKVTTQLVDSGFGTSQTNTVKAFDYSLAASDWWVKLTSSAVTSKALSSSWAPYDATLDSNKTVTTSFTNYDSASRKPKNITVSPSTGKASTVATIYNAYGLPTRVTSSSSGETSRVVTSTYTTDNYFVASATKVIDEAIASKNHTVSMETDPEHGQVKKVTDANGLITLSDYDAFGRLEKVTPPNGTGQPAYSRFTWCLGGCGELGAINGDNVQYKVTTYQAGAPVSTAYKDQFNRVLVTKTEGFAGADIFVTTQLDSLGHTTFTSVPSFSQYETSGTHYNGFDALGRPMEKVIDQAAGKTMTVTYNYLGYQTNIDAATSDGKSINMSRTYSGSGQLMKTTDALNGITQYAYDGMGSPIILQDAKGSKIKASYNALGQKLYVNDPNMGYKSFTYTGFGEVDTETDANLKTYDYNYDRLGRLAVRKLNAVNDAVYVYDTLCKGAVTSETGTNGYLRTYGYDTKCRATSVVTNIDGTPYTLSTQYDGNYGRPKAITYPTGLTAASVYNPRGYLTQTKNAASGYVYHEVKQMDARGQLIEAKKANGILTEWTQFAEETGQMETIYTHTSNLGDQRHRIDYNYDGFGNLNWQQVENMQGAAVITSRESYIYDDLHRLYSSQRIIAGVTQTEIKYRYDSVGNFTLKDDYVNSYAYGNVGKSLGGNAGPNAVRSISKVGGGTISYEYDANGNQLRSIGSNSIDNKTITYNAFNKPLTIAKNGITSAFSYGADHMRYKQVKTGLPTGTETTIYIDKAYEKITQGSVVKHRVYLGDAIITKTIGGSEAGDKIGFVHRDRLGSVVTITDHSGNVVDNKSFDPFGKPRKGTLASVTPSTLKNIAAIGNFTLHTNRGFTDHEHLDDAELIDMGGRVYDYNLGRFLSVDPLIHNGSQGVNPYSYIMNNPLSGTDPTGYAPEKETIEVSKDTQVFTDSDGNNYVDAGDGSGDMIKVESVSGKASNGNQVSISFGDNGKMTSYTASNSAGSLSISDIGSQQQVTTFTPKDNSGDIQQNPNGLGDDALSKASTPVSNSKSDLKIFRANAGKAITRLKSFIALIESKDSDTINLIASTYGYTVLKGGLPEVTQMVLNKSKEILVLLLAAVENPSNIFRANAVGANGWHQNGNIFLPNDWFTTGGPGAVNTLIHEFGHAVGMQHKGYVINWVRGDYMDNQKALSKYANLPSLYPDEDYRQIAFESQWSYDYIIATKYGEN